MRPLFLAHRGDTKRGVENTIEAIEAAAAAGIDGVEVDVQVSADGVPFLFHDDTLERLAGRPEKARSLPWSVLQSIELRGTGPVPSHLPTLREVCERFASRLFLNLELKTPLFRERRMIESVAAVLEKFNPERFLLSSFNPLAIRTVHNRLLSFKTGLLFHEKMIRPGRELWIRRWIGPNAVHPSIALATKERIDRYQREGFEIFVWTVNRESDMSGLVPLGVTGIISDDVGMMCRFKEV